MSVTGFCNASIAGVGVWRFRDLRVQACKDQQGMPIAKTAGVRLAVEGIERDLGSSRFLCLELRDVRIPKKLFEF